MWLTHSALREYWRQDIETVLAAGREAFWLNSYRRWLVMTAAELYGGAW